MKWWEEEIKSIKNDNINGASFLTKKSIDIIKNMVLKKENIDEIYKALNLLEKVQPYMASIYNFAKSIKSKNHENIFRECDNFLLKIQNEEKEIIDKSIEIFNDNKIFMTHSFSSLVYKVFLEAKKRGKNFKVICTKSEPKNEGIKLAQNLCENGIETELIIDAAACYFIEKIDCVLLGADGVGGFGLIHKIGTIPIALTAKEKNKKVFSLAPKYKFWPNDFVIPPQEFKDPNEVAKKSCYKIKNLYFDITPLENIQFITN
ncbi:hypothetical protein [Nitrosophilus kaiyonis]|uniref:hypothetical protein n=1 Tax=Nitrosophilus kaiyonis TaxID=2930200 RepID=UPI0024918D0D|nr:hypothetical protein [Nitrosophilus kaiyonis]